MCAYALYIDRDPHYKQAWDKILKKNIVFMKKIMDWASNITQTQFP